MAKGLHKLMMRSVCIGTFFIMAAGGLQGAATNRYVTTNGASVYPYTNWADAGTSIIDVVNVATNNNAGDMVIVSNGTYYLTNQIVILHNVIMTNFSGDRTRVIINGNYPTTTNRCFYIEHANAIVSGFTITNGYVTTNSNGGDGGAVYLLNGTVKDCLITGNRSVVNTEYANHGGAGIKITHGTVDNCSVVGNITTGAAGGWYGGGGIALINNDSLVTNCYVAFNTATNARGGGFDVRGGNVFNCTIVSNNSYQGGGLHFHAGGTTEVRNCNISGNYCTQSGGGIFIGSEGALVRIRNCLITSNRAASQGGGIALQLSVGAMNPIIESSTICSNTSYSRGGGIAFGAGGANCVYLTNVWNCIIYDNYASLSQPNMRRDIAASSTSVVYSCTVTESGLGEFYIVGVVTSRPSFADAPNGNYRLKKDSPCINAGTNRPWMTDSIDLDGRPRIRYGTVDMGAYEYIYPGTLYTIR